MPTSTLGSAQPYAAIHNVVTTSGGNIYVFQVDRYYYGITVWKSTDGGSNFSSVSTQSADTIHGGGASSYVYGFGAAIDGAGYVHCIAQDYAISTRHTAYNKFNTADDTWGTWELIDAGDVENNQNYLVDIAIDSSNKPHVVFIKTETNMGNDYYRVYYSNKTGASWLTAEMVSTATTSAHYDPFIVVRNSDIVEVVYNKTNSVTYYRTRTSGSWGTETSYTGNEVPRITVTSDNTVYRYSHGISNYYLYENSSRVESILCSDEFVLNKGTTRYLLYDDNSDNNYIKMIKNSGSSWSTPVTIITDTLLYSLQTENSYNYHYAAASRINLVYYSEYTMKFFGYDMVVRSSKPAYLKGSTNVTSSKHVYLEGKGGSPKIHKIKVVVPGKHDTATSSRTYAYLEGYAPSAKTRQLAYLYGAQPVSSRIYSYIQGSTSVIANKHAYLSGGVAVASHAHAFMQGGVVIASSSDAFLRGGVIVVDRKGAYAIGGVVLTSRSLAYTKGETTARANQKAYLSGPQNQTLVPILDIASGNWINELSGSELYPSLADGSDTTYAWYQQASAGEYFEVKLTEGDVPAVGDQTLIWRAYRKSGALSVTLKCELRQGTDIIASDQQTLTDSVQQFEYVLSTGEKASISDYTNLRVRVTIMEVS